MSPESRCEHGVSAINLRSSRRLAPYSREPGELYYPLGSECRLGYQTRGSAVEASLRQRARGGEETWVNRRMCHRDDKNPYDRVAQDSEEPNREIRSFGGA